MEQQKLGKYSYKSNISSKKQVQQRKVTILSKRQETTIKKNERKMTYIDYR